MDLLKEKLEGLSCGRLVDIATGGGYFIKKLKDSLIEYDEIIGIDTNEKALDVAKENFNEENIKFIKIDANKLSFEDESIDTVTLSNSLHHLNDYESVLSEVKRVLKTGGLFIVSEMFCDNQNEKQQSHVKLHHLAGEIDTLGGNFHGETYKRQELINILRDSEFDIFDVFEHGHPNDQISYMTEEEQTKALDAWLNGIGGKLETIKDLPQYEKLNNKYLKLKEELYDKGILSATQLMIICRKI